MGRHHHGGWFGRCSECLRNAVRPELRRFDAVVEDRPELLVHALVRRTQCLELVDLIGVLGVEALHLSLEVGLPRFGLLLGSLPDVGSLSLGRRGDFTGPFAGGVDDGGGLRPSVVDQPFRLSAGVVDEGLGVGRRFGRDSFGFAVEVMRFLAGLGQESFGLGVGVRQDRVCLRAGVVHQRLSFVARTRSEVFDLSVDVAGAFLGLVHEAFSFLVGGGNLLACFRLGLGEHLVSGLRRGCKGQLERLLLLFDAADLLLQLLDRGPALSVLILQLGELGLEIGYLVGFLAEDVDLAVQLPDTSFERGDEVGTLGFFLGFGGDERIDGVDVVSLAGHLEEVARSRHVPRLLDFCAQRCALVGGCSAESAAT